MNKHIMILVTGVSELSDGRQTGVWLEEFAVPYQRFTDENWIVTIASPQGGLCSVDPASIPAVHNKDWDFVCEVLNDTEKLSNLDYENFNAVVIPGGHGAMFDLAGNEDVTRFLSRFFFNGKLIAAICHGPAALIPVRTFDNHPIVSGRKITAFSNEEEKLSGNEKFLPFSLEDKLKETGAVYSCAAPGEAFVINDDNIITAQNPASSKTFADAVITYLKESE